MAERTGKDIAFEALERLPNDDLIFEVSGSLGKGLLIEARPQISGEFFLHRHAFIYGTHAKLGCHELSRVRWHVWLAAQATGDQSLEGLSDIMPPWSRGPVA
jgi:hypothetical protein